MWIRRLIEQQVWNPPGEAGAAGAGDTGSAGGSGADLNNAPDASGRDETADFVLDAFKGMSQDYDDVDDTEVVEATPEPAPAPAATEPGAQPPVAGSQPAQQAQPTAPAQQPGQAMPPGQQAGQPQGTPPGDQQQAAPPTQQPSAEDSPDFGRLGGMIEQNRQAFIQGLAQQAYQLNPQELEQLQTDPGTVIANMAAKIQVQTTESMMKVLGQNLPIVVNQLVQAQAKNLEAENKFWAANPGLNRELHTDIVKSIGAFVSQHNPQLRGEAWMKTVGNMAMAQLGLTHNALQQAAATQQATAPQAPPAGMVVNTPGRVVRQVSPPPPVGGMHGAPPGAQPAPQMGEWDRMLRMAQTYDD